jgi:Fe2+ or Zn2+ uptake regulation protein
VVEFASDLTETLKAEQAAANGFAVTGAHIDLAGYCGACRAAGKDR